MRVHNLFEGLEYAPANSGIEGEIRGICYDSRKVEPGDLFVAIRGEKTDGARFIKSALERGAALVVCERTPESDCPHVLVKDARQALAVLSANFYGNPARELKLIGVTGTNGKTTITHLIHHMLSAQGIKAGLIGTNEIVLGDESLPAERTTPESLELHRLFRQMRDRGCSHVVMEVSSHALALDRVFGLEFAVGIFTNLTQDHLDFHDTMEEYFTEKAKLFDRSGLAVINFDDPYGRRLIEGLRQRRQAEGKRAPALLTYADGADEADLVAKNVHLSAQGASFAAVMRGEIARIGLGIPGRFSVSNALAALGCGVGMGMGLNEAADLLRDARPVKGRVETVPVPAGKGAGYSVVIDYAHTPDSMENVLRSMRETTDGRIIAVFGCGGNRDKTKRPIMGRIAAENADLCIVTSDNPRDEEPMDIIGDILPGTKGGSAQVIVEPDRVRAIHLALDEAKENDLVILLGKGHETYQEIKGVFNHMDEREIVAAYFDAGTEK